MSVYLYMGTCVYSRYFNAWFCLPFLFPLPSLIFTSFYFSFLSPSLLFFLEANTTSNTLDVTMLIFSIGKVTWFLSRKASSSWNLGLMAIPYLCRPLHSKAIVDGVPNIMPATGQKRRREQHTVTLSMWPKPESLGKSLGEGLSTLGWPMRMPVGYCLNLIKCYGKTQSNAGSTIP